MLEVQRQPEEPMASHAAAQPIPDQVHDHALDIADYTTEELAASIRDELRLHLESIGLGTHSAVDVATDAKDLVRFYHADHRRAYRAQEAEFVATYGRDLVDRHFASGGDVDPCKIQPVLSPVMSDTEDARLFRLATLLWSVPVSRGYGRRLRFLVRDRSNGKLIGLFGLADPVFNLRARDAWIGWSSEDRRSRLVNVMDAHVVGAVPPYTHLLGGKLIASLMTAKEVTDTFAAKYAHTTGQISHEQKHAQLLLLTVTSALGRSSIYNRLRLPDFVDFQRIGMTEGWGHFHVPEHLFMRMRLYLRRIDHPYASGHQYGDGPNWRMRVVRTTLAATGLDPNIMRHGINREVYASPLAAGWQAFLRRETNDCPPLARPSVAEISEQALARWIIPRAQRRPEYRHWTREQTWEALATGYPSLPLALNTTEASQP